MNILTSFTIMLILAGAFTARDAVRCETIVLSSLGLLLLGAAIHQRFKR